MGWWPFGRRDAGRHGLGAAVTSIPSGPLIVPVTVPVPVVDPTVAAALARAQAEAALLPSLPLDEVARVLGVRPEGDPGAAPSGPPACPVPSDSGPGSSTASLAPAVPGPDPAGPTHLDLPAQAVIGPVHVPVQTEPSSRVQLGFRDGSTTRLDDVDQARALEDLARALTSSG